MRFLILLVLWCVLLVICWPLAVFLLVAVPVLYLLAIPFRVVYWVLEGVFGLVRGILLLPARVLAPRTPCLR